MQSEPRLPAPLRVLRQLRFCSRPRYKQKPVDEGACRDRPDRANCGTRPFIEFADDNTFVDRKPTGSDCCPSCSKRRHPLVHRNRPVASHEDDGAARPDAGQRLRGGAHRPREPGRSGPRRARAEVQLEAPALARVPRGDPDASSPTASRVNGCFVLGLDGQHREVFDAGVRLRAATRSCTTCRSRC